MLSRNIAQFRRELLKVQRIVLAENAERAKLSDEARIKQKLEKIGRLPRQRRGVGCAAGF
jgi:hypothetical protein